MRVFAAVLKNDLHRMAQQKPRFALFLFMTVGAIVLALFFNTKADVIGNIAVVSPEGVGLAQGSATNDAVTLSDHLEENIGQTSEGTTDVSSEGNSGFTSDHLNITWLDEAPPLSELAMGKYDAVVTFDRQGTYEIKTIRSDDFIQLLDAALSDPSAFSAEQIGSRGPGTNIIGFLLVFIMMQGITMMFLFSEDKERKQIRRIASSPVSFTAYLCAHGFFVFLSLLVPVMAMLTIAEFIPGMGLGFSLIEYLFLSTVVCALATSFGLFLTALVKKGDWASMIGSAIVIVTSVLAGSFYSFDKGNRILETLITVLPQKAFLSMSNLLEQGGDITVWYPYGLYVVGLSVFFFTFAVIKTRRDYIKG